MDIKDTFKGNNARLLESIGALLRLDEKGSLHPHGIGGFARDLLSSSHVRIESLTAQIDALQLRLNAVEEENDRLRQDCIAMRAVIDETGCSFDEVGDMYADAALNDRRYRLLRDRMCVDDFPEGHPEWSTPSESESIRIDQLCDAALAMEKQP